MLDTKYMQKNKVSDQKDAQFQPAVCPAHKQQDGRKKNEECEAVK
jgi:hypothetical protein